MSALDLLVVGGVLVCAILAARRGFLFTTVTSLGWALALNGALEEYPALEGALVQLAIPPGFSIWLASALVGLLILWAAYWIGALVNHFRERLALHEVDQILGALLGAFVAWALFSMLVACLYEAEVPWIQGPLFTKSSLVPHLKEFSNSVSSRWLEHLLSWWHEKINRSGP